jgi:hypothetical protein
MNKTFKNNLNFIYLHHGIMDYLFLVYMYQQLNLMMR